MFVTLRPSDRLEVKAALRRHQVHPSAQIGRIRLIAVIYEIYSGAEFGSGSNVVCAGKRDKGLFASSN